MLNRERKFEQMVKIEAEKAEKETMDIQIYQLKREVADLKDELKAAEFDRFDAENIREILPTLYDQNLIDKDGKLV